MPVVKTETLYTDLIWLPIFTETGPQGGGALANGGRPAAVLLRAAGGGGLHLHGADGQEEASVGGGVQPQCPGGGWSSAGDGQHAEGSTRGKTHLSGERKEVQLHCFHAVEKDSVCTRGGETVARGPNFPLQSHYIWPAEFDSYVLGDDWLLFCCCCCWSHPLKSTLASSGAPAYGPLFVLFVSIYIFVIFI